MARSAVGCFSHIIVWAVLSIAATGCEERATAAGGLRPPSGRRVGGTGALAAPAPDAGGHALHLRDTPIHRAFQCGDCHVCPGPAPIFGALAAQQGATPSWDANARTCSGVYCHGARLAAPPVAPPAWTTAEPDLSAPLAQVCSPCHGYPPPAPHPQRVASCWGCHPATVLEDGHVDVAGGHHVDGRLDFAVSAGAGCEGCHGFPPDTGAHAAHFGLADASAGAEYGDTSILQDRFPGAAAASAPSAYAFGCGNCHPLDPAKHIDRVLQVELRDPAAPAGSLKARASPTAAYDPATGTCSGTYCHSSGQEAPTYLSTASWRAPVKLACDGCHANPPRYASGGAGAPIANSHVALGSNGHEWGHFLGEAGPRHGAYHGNVVAGRDAAPITCQTCHFDTTDPASTGASGFYFLDTTGAYQLPGGDPARLTTTKYLQLECTLCHVEGGPATPGAGRVLPLRHVNGSRDVVFDPRTSLPDLPWLPTGPNRPTLPYWVAGASPTQWRGTVTWNGTTVSFALAGATYDAAAKTCSNVACHLFRPPTWGAPSRCAQCHEIH